MPDKPKKNIYVYEAKFNKKMAEMDLTDLLENYKKTRYNQDTFSKIFKNFTKQFEKTNIKPTEKIKNLYDSCNEQLAQIVFLDLEIAKSIHYLKTTVNCAGINSDILHKQGKIFKEKVTKYISLFVDFRENFIKFKKAVNQEINKQKRSKQNNINKFNKKTR